MRGWRSRRSTSAASSSIERPIVSPVPAVFSISSQVSSVQRSRHFCSAGTTRFSPLSKPAPWWEPTWKITPSAPMPQATSTVFCKAATDLS